MSWRTALPLLLTIVFPAAAVALVCLHRPDSMVEWGLQVLFCVSFAAAWLMVWPVVLLGYTWHGLVCAGLAAGACLSYCRIAPGPLTLTLGHGLHVALLLACTAGLVLSVARAVRGYVAPPGCLSLEFPFRGGTFCAVSGGGSTWTNFHGAPNQRYGIDIVQVNRLGMQSPNPLSGNPSDYAIFGATLFSPCDGVVLLAQDGMEDNPVGWLPARNTAGNLVLIRNGEYKILLGHLKEGSVRVAAGQQVKAGQPIGQIGNSGWSSCPHLHLSVATGGSPEGPYDGNGAAFEFDGRLPVRNSLFVQAP